MERIDFKISLLFAPLAYAIHHMEEHVFADFREWRLIHFPARNNPLTSEAVLTILMTATFFYIIYYHISPNKAAAEGTLFFLSATQVNNIIFHVAFSIFTASYSPGAITALLLYFPVNYVIFRKALQEQLVSIRGAVILFILGGIAFWLFEFIGAIMLAIGFLLSWLWIIFAPRFLNRLDS